MLDKAYTRLEGAPIRIQPPSLMPYEGLTGIDQDEMHGKRAKAETARQVKNEVGSDHTNVFMTVTVHPDRKDKAQPQPQPRTSGSTLLARMKKVLWKWPGTNKAKIDSTTLSIAGTTLYLNHTTGDGNCFYHAVFESLTGMRSSGSTQRQIRQSAVSVMLTDPVVQTHLFGEIPDQVAVSEVIALLLQDGAWTENFTPSFIAEALNLEIRVLRQDGTPYYTARPTEARPGLRVIYCVYTGDHYNSCTERPLGGGQGGSGSDHNRTDKERP